MNMPSIQTDNTLTTFFADSMTLWFSYTTLIAFRVGAKKVVHKNIWSKTTGRHLNSIDGGDNENRVNAETFARKWQELTSKPEPSGLLG